MAIKRPTVLVVGAGASRELRFPDSRELLDQIASALDFDGDGFKLTRGDKFIHDEFVRTQDRGNRISVLWQAAQRVRDAAHLGISIDNVIHQMAGDDDFAYCAKLAIVRRILDAERSSDLRIEDPRHRPSWPAVRGTWLGGLAQMIVQGRQQNDLEGLFTNLTIICFNYDRNIQRFLPLALSSQFAIPIEQANELASRLTIVHPYGSIGPLEWEDRKSAVPYGADRCDLTKAIENIQTFTEQARDTQHIDIMRESLTRAKQVIFLGFGYIPQNMELLLRGVEGEADGVYGTCAGLAEPDRETVTSQLNVLFAPHMRNYKSARLVDKFCAPFIQEHFRTFTS
jgi:hypothetical protein